MDKLDSKLISNLQTSIHFSVKILAILMTFVIFMGDIPIEAML